MAEWYRRDCRAALNGMRGLKPEERGVYTTALDLIYEEEGPITTESLAHELRIRERRTWDRLVRPLIDKGKLVELADGRLHNERAMVEITLMRTDTEERSASGSKGGRKRVLREAKARAAAQREMFAQSDDSRATRAEKANENNPATKAQLDHARPRTHARAVGHQSGTSSPPVEHQSANSIATRPEKPNGINGTPQAQLKHIDSDSDIREESPLSPPIGDASETDDETTEQSQKKSRRAAPLPPTWEPPPATERIGEIVTAWDDGEYERESEKFVNHALAGGRTCKDWDAAFRNWIIQADEYRQRRMPHHDRPSGWLAARL